MRKPCKTKRCANLAVVGGAYCLDCRRKRRKRRRSRGVCRDWSIYAISSDDADGSTQASHFAQMETSGLTLEMVPTAQSTVSASET